MQNQCAVENRKIGEIERELNSLVDAVENLENLSLKFGQKISPILHAVPQAVTNNGAPLPSLCPLADQIREIYFRINRVCSTVDELDSRIEL